MTAKEKAEELVETFYCNIDFNECYQGSKISAKQCALICVDEILEIYQLDDYSFWKEVKQEINK